MAEKSDIATPSSLYYEQEELRELSRSLMGGTRAMRAKRTDYLPKEEAESEDAYNERLHRTFLYNGFAKTVWSSVGKVLDRPIQVEAPETVEGWMANVTNEGRDINQFAGSVFADALAEGISYIHVEYPRSHDGATVADEKPLRPYLVDVKAEDVIFWTWETIDGHPVMTEVRIKEQHYDENAEAVPTVRVLRQGSFELWQSLESGEWTMVDFGPVSLPVIPLVPVYGKRDGVFMGEPPLRDLADLNLMHWQSSSDQRHILHVARVPILFAKGWGDNTERLTVGPNRLVKATADGASLEYVEHSGKAIAAGQKDIEDIEKRMGSMGMELLAPDRPGDVTATQKAIEKAESESTLSAMAINLQNALTAAINMMMAFQSIEGEATVDVRTAFELKTSDGTELDQILTLRERGDLTLDSTYKEFMRRGVLRDDFDATEEEEALAIEGPSPFSSEQLAALAADRTADEGQPS